MIVTCAQLHEHVLFLEWVPVRYVVLVMLCDTPTSDIMDHACNMEAVLACQTCETIWPADHIETYLYFQERFKLSNQTKLLTTVAASKTTILQF